MQENIQKAAERIKNSSFTTAFTGAGISVESGIPPFRGDNGLWSKYDPMVLDLNYFHSHPKESWSIIREIFYDFFGKAKPNAAHTVLAEMEKKQLLQAVITQNIDNLHQEAGNKVVYEYHGTSQNLICTQCDKMYTLHQINLSQIPVTCKSCKGLLKPDFIFFGEGIPQDAHDNSIKSAVKSEVFIIIGTTGEIIPASYIPRMAWEHKATIIEINTEKSNFTNSITDIFLKGKATEIMQKLKTELFTS